MTFRKFRESCRVLDSNLEPSCWKLEKYPTIAWKITLHQRFMGLMLELTDMLALSSVVKRCVHVCVLVHIGAIDQFVMVPFCGGEAVCSPCSLGLQTENT